MPATSTVSNTNDPYIDGVLSGTKWAVNSFTFSFPTDPSFYSSPFGAYGSGEPSNGFEAFNATQQAAVRSALAMYSSVANVTFTEITETASRPPTRMSRPIRGSRKRPSSNRVHEISTCGQWRRT